ncbi:MAG TPA: hypothetical protein VKB53_09515, partial [Gammaproteobacteria bacterium]|nr:hypothetical protein [Gammaproteobacteria bacterium]
ATRNPSIKEQCLQRESELLPRFAEHYQQLRALRRRVRRSLQRQWKRSLAGVTLLLAFGQVPALAATINVNSTCTLVRAIAAASVIIAISAVILTNSTISGKAATYSGGGIEAGMAPLPD